MSKLRPREVICPSHMARKEHSWAGSNPGLILKPKHVFLASGTVSGVGNASISLSSSCFQLALKEKTFVQFRT